MKQGILNLSKNEIVKWLGDNKFPKFRADQILLWLYRFGTSSFFEMRNIGKNLQNLLDESFYIYRPEIIQHQKSTDGTIKFLLKINGKDTIETVFIPDKNRNTLCVSCQVGCSLGCKFCNTGYHGFARNLSIQEIIGQFLIVKDHLKLWEENSARLSNVVFMGMGEPLLNIENVLQSVEMLLYDEEEGLSRRKITISTSGVVPVLNKISKDLKTRLAISLHAPNNEIRNKIMPINNVYNIESLMDACKTYCNYHPSLKITFEYLMLRDLNDSEEQAYELAKLLRNINSKVNIIRFNEWPNCTFKSSDKKTIEKFIKILLDHNIETMIRSRRGRDIMAACGQLQSSEL